MTWYTDLQSGWLESKRLGLPMVIFITSDRCVYCDAMKRDTWCNSDIQNSLSGDFIAIRLTPKTNHETLSRIKIPAFPTTLLGSPSGKVIAHRVGYQPPRAMRGLLAEADQYEVR
ncbi:MAG: thioredoxin family protein [Pirellulaceae bacterium]|nr:thioredoxin family protein [Pirellulaceae bacterium]